MFLPCPVYGVGVRWRDGWRRSELAGRVGRGLPGPLPPVDGPRRGRGFCRMRRRMARPPRARLRPDPGGCPGRRGSFKATQIKEKFGTLRFYWDGTLSPEAAARIEEAMIGSAHNSARATQSHPA